jgi:hypothetical protein
MARLTHSRRGVAIGGIMTQRLVHRAGNKSCKGEEHSWAREGLAALIAIEYHTHL